MAKAKAPLAQPDDGKGLTTPDPEPIPDNSPATAEPEVSEATTEPQPATVTTEPPPDGEKAEEKSGEKTLTVLAAKGGLVPLEGRPRVYIDDRAPIAVPDTLYYRRRLADGSLIASKGD